MSQGRKKAGLVHEKIKRASDLDLIQFNVKIPAYLLRDIKTYGDTSKLLRNALEMANKRKFANNLMEIISEIKSEVELIEVWRDAGREEIDLNHLRLLEIYKDCYFKMKAAGILKKKKA